MRGRHAPVLVAFLAIAPAVAAQDLEVTPFVGMHVPAFEMMNEFAPSLGQITISHRAGVTIGGRVAVPVSRRVAFEGVVAYAASDARIASSSLGNYTEEASVTIVGGALRVPLSRPGQAAAFHLGAGAAFVTHGGKFWKTFRSDLKASGISLDGTTSLGLMLGGGLALRLRGTTLRLDLETHLYAAKLTFSDAVSSASTESQPEADLRVSAGLTLGRPRAP